MNAITHQMSLMNYLFNHSIMLGKIIGFIYECTFSWLIHFKQAYFTVRKIYKSLVLQALCGNLD